MTLVLKKIATTTIDVPVQVPGDEKPSTIQATWVLHNWASYRAIVDAQQKREKTDEDLLGDLKNVAGLKDESGNDLVFDKELLDALMDITYIRRPLILSWFAAQEGRNQAAAKN
ncbi:hypothetical protein [Vreelandella nanhaiensis]|uniref:Phage tail protein n=1 Tax=Vreelandella nanhaiensis TaxID=1258546 RepID=A0A3S0W8A1_9GAMM|nr:hypothetical protein [Halomonas nanhaiensis]RUR34475.1 hypothetical protein ELY38_02475 [Halomonas nanhaiensis]